MTNSCAFASETVAMAAAAAAAGLGHLISAGSVVFLLFFLLAAAAPDRSTAISWAIRLGMADGRQLSPITSTATASCFFHWTPQ